MQIKLITNYFKALFFSKSPFLYLANTTNKISFLSIVLIYAMHLMVSFGVFFLSVTFLPYFAQNPGEISGESLPFIFLAIQTLTFVLIMIQPVITYLVYRFYLNKKIDIWKYIISLLYVSSTLTWFYMLVILGSLLELMPKFISVTPVILLFIESAVYLMFIYRNITAAKYIVDVSTRVAFCIASWPLLLVIYIILGSFKG